MSFVPSPLTRLWKTSASPSGWTKPVTRMPAVKKLVFSHIGQVTSAKESSSAPRSTAGPAGMSTNSAASTIDVTSGGSASSSPSSSIHRRPASAPKVRKACATPPGSFVASRRSTSSACASEPARSASSRQPVDRLGLTPLVDVCRAQQRAGIGERHQAPLVGLGDGAASHRSAHVRAELVHGGRLSPTHARPVEMVAEQVLP